MILIAALALGGLGGLSGAALGYEVRRRRRFVAGARSRGWTYARRDRALAERFDGWPFGVGRYRRARHVLRGTTGDRPCVAFEYSFRHRVPGGPDGPGEATSIWSVVAVGMPAPLPRIVVTRRSALGRAVAALGRQGLQFESEDFNRHYRVRSDDPRVAYDVVHPRLMAALLDGPAFDFRVEATDALSCWPGRLRLDEIDQRLPFLRVVIDSVPEYVWRGRPQ